jgi:hypothetical protein
MVFRTESINSNPVVGIAMTVYDGFKDLIAFNSSSETITDIQSSHTWIAAQQAKIVLFNINEDGQEYWLKKGVFNYVTCTDTIVIPSITLSTKGVIQSSSNVQKFTARKASAGYDDAVKLAHSTLYSGSRIDYTLFYESRIDSVQLKSIEGKNVKTLKLALADDLLRIG